MTDQRLQEATQFEMEQMGCQVVRELCMTHLTNAWDEQFDGQCSLARQFAEVRLGLR